MRQMVIRGICKLTLDGKVLGVLGTTGHGLDQFGWIHELARPAEKSMRNKLSTT
jgi:hypothetical protein